jgi:hypothetical protein
MDGDVTVSLGAIIGVLGFLLQIGLTVGAIAFSHGGLNQRVRAIEDKQRENALLATSVTRLETEMEGVSREIKGLREDLRLARSEIRARPTARVRSARSPYEFPGAREWILEDELDA